MEAERGRDEEGLRARECDSAKKKVMSLERVAAEVEEKGRIRADALSFALEKQKEVCTAPCSSSCFGNRPATLNSKP